MDKWLWALSASRVLSRGEGDGNVVKSRGGSVQADFQAWKTKFLSRLQALARGEKKTCSGKCKKSSCKNKKKHHEEEEGGHQSLERHSSEASQARLGHLYMRCHGNGPSAIPPHWCKTSLEQKQKQNISAVIMFPPCRFNYNISV